jgi:hypothetical protein
MRVMCEQVTRATDGRPAPGSPWLTVGHEYVVLEVVAEPAGRVLFRLTCDTGEPAVFDSRMFRSTSSILPSTWTAELAPSGVLTLAPAEWQQDGFWEAYFNRDPAAAAAFEGASAKLLSEDDAARRGEGRPAGPGIP